jgi:hypothetical protein
MAKRRTASPDSPHPDGAHLREFPAVPVTALIASELLSISPASARRLVRGRLPPGRPQELQALMMKAGMPL